MSYRTTSKPLVYADPDDTEGRRLYRQQADAIARAQLAYEKRRVRLTNPLPPESTNG